MRRCLAFPDDLDAGAPLRSREHLDILSADTNYGIMWDQYGVAGDTLVCVNVFPFPAHYADYLGTSPSPISDVSAQLAGKMAPKQLHGNFHQ